jgi:hypothetical protein
MNLTLSIDERLLKEARKAAIELDTSVNALIRGHLEELVRKHREKKDLFLEKWRALMDDHPIDANRARWSRDCLHER